MNKTNKEPLDRIERLALARINNPNRKAVSGQELYEGAMKKLDECRKMIGKKDGEELTGDDILRILRMVQVGETNEQT